jgi:hypothetical protein
VSENETPHSGSRWEPGAAQPETPEPATAQQPAQSWPPPAAPPQEPFYTAEAPTPARGGRGRVALAAAAVGLVAAGGLGGFVIGQASSGNASETGVVQGGVPGGGGAEGGTPGQFPGGTRPEIDRDGDGDGAHGAPPGADDGTQTAPDGSTDQGTS